MKCLFLAIGCLVIHTVFAQSTTLLSGYLKDSTTHEAVPYASITNLTNHKTILSNKDGFFKIPIKENQLISFASVGYSFDTLRIVEKLMSQDTVIISLKPITISLQTVYVTGKAKYSTYQIDSIQRRNDFFQSMSQHALPVVSLANSGAGIGFNLDHFYGREKRKRKVLSLFDQIEQEQYINYRFTPAIVNKYATLSDDSLSIFIQQCRPSYDWLRKHSSEEDLIYYINDKLKLFFKRKDN